MAAPENEGSATKEISRHHKVTVSTSGLVSILGGKWTTYRKMSEDLINTAQSVGGLPERACITHSLPSTAMTIILIGRTLYTFTEQTLTRLRLLMMRVTIA